MIGGTRLEGNDEQIEPGEGKGQQGEQKYKKTRWKGECVWQVKNKGVVYQNNLTTHYV